MAAISPLEAIRAVLAIDRLPDGQPMPAHLSHALLVLATFWPNIWPSQERLAHDMHVSKSQVNRRLDALEDAGLIIRLVRSGGKQSTLYRLRLASYGRADASPMVAPTRLEEQRRPPVTDGGFFDE